MAYTQTILIGKQCFVGGVRHKTFIHGELQTPRGKVAVCPVCGEAWMHAIVQDSEGRTTRFFIFTQPCEVHAQQTDCGTVFGPPGSLLEGGMRQDDTDWNSSLTAELLAREVQLHLQYEHLRPYYGWLPVYFNKEK